MPVGADGKVALFNNTGSTHLIVDVQGYYATPDGERGGEYHPSAPFRVLDTRDDGEPLAPDRGDLRRRWTPPVWT